jgi:Vacuolar protein sorting-associated protein 62
VYAHIATQADRPGYLAVQYWLYWYYNDWNDRHESDWEFIQVLFKADTVQEALGERPVSVGYAQHTGGETADWNDPKLEKEGTHPVVYSSQGSHASYYAPALYLGRAADEGFGCDNTQSPSTRVTPRAVLLPDAPSGPDDQFAWLAYSGRWGERHSGSKNGPDGPAGKPRWAAPVTWQKDLRASSFVIPGGSGSPPAIVGTFCTVVGAGSQVFLDFAANPTRVFIIGVLLFMFLGFLLRRTSWSVVPLTPVVARRRAGQIVRASVRIYRRHPVAYLATGLLAVPVGLVATGLTRCWSICPTSATRSRSRRTRRTTRAASWPSPQASGRRCGR